VLFNTLEYALFLPLSFAVYWLCAPFRKARLSLLLGCSYIFYAFWDPRFLPLLFASSSID
jgi:alginate O-acetyltransferase complex protein AlgI